MNEKVNVAEAKKRFSELLARTAFKGEHFIITRRGKPMAALVDLEQLARVEGRATRSDAATGLLGAAGALADYKTFEDMMKDVVRSRASARPRPVDLS
jgi:prevent-host-death family protein